MNKLFRVIPLAAVLTVVVVGVSFAQEVRKNQSFREEYRTEGIQWCGRAKTVVKNYTREGNIQDSIEYREYYDNGWWSGILKRGDAKFDHGNNRWSVTFSGTLRETECFRTLALDEGEKVFGEIISVSSFTQLSGDKRLSGVKDISEHSWQKREIRVLVHDFHSVPNTYDYEEYHEKKGCYYGGKLTLSRIYKEKGSIIAVYYGVIYAAC